MPSNRQTVLILTGDPAFSREITASWPRDPAYAPEFIVLDQDPSRDLRTSCYDLAIADVSSADSSNQRIQALKHSLAAAAKPAIMIHSDPARDLYHVEGQILDLRREPGVWSALAGLLGREILRRRHAEWRASEAEKISAAAQAEATLGRYMVEMRANVNNALTTVLGNSELLVHEPGLPATVQCQADSVRNMALRLHEVFQRFWSLEKELTVAARESGKKTNAAAVGTS
jgi:hypothetical protein